MQIGADIYCDTQIIVRELERRYPSPSMYVAGDEGLTNALAFWADRPLFTLACDVLFSGREGAVNMAPKDPFTLDREALFERTFDMEARAAAVPNALDQLRAHLGWIDDQLADGRAFLLGDKPGHADACAFYNLAFIRWANPGVMDKVGALTHLRAWEGRVKGVGHGQRTEMSREEALDIAKASTSTEAPKADPEEPNGFKPGDAVTVGADDYGKDRVAGEIVSTSAQHIAIKRTDPRVGEVVLHFPRAGFIVKAA